jgi:hypothetical protein
MPGFMAGFGSGFSSAFERGLAMEKAKQENTFEKMYKTFETNKSYLDEYKTQDAKDVQAAKAIMGQVPGMPGEALGEVYQKVKSLGYDDALKWAAAVKLEKTGTIPTQTDAAMNSGKAPQGENVFAPVAPKSAGGGAMDKIKGGIDQLKYFGQKNVYEGQIKRMQEATGLGRKEVEKILTMNQGGIPMDAEVEAASRNQFQATPIEQGGQTMLDQVPVEKIWEQRNKIFTAANEENTKLQGRKTNLTTLVGSVAENTRMAQENPAIITTYASGASQLLTAAKQEILSIMEITTGGGAKVNKDAAPAMAQRRTDIEKRIDDLENLNVVDAAGKVARDKELFAQRKALDAYTLASMYAQDGRSLSEAERTLFQKMFDSDVDPAAYAQNMKELVNREIAITDMKSQEVDSRVGVTDFNTQIDNSKYKGNKSFYVDFNTSTFTDDIKGTPTEEALAFINQGQAPSGTATPPPAAGTTPPPAEGAPVTPAPQDTGQVQTVVSQEQYNALPPGTRYRAPDGSVRTKGGQ